MWDIAAPLPLLVIADLLGFEEEHYDDLLRWSDDMIRATTLDPPPEVAEAGLRAMLGFRELQLGVIADRRADPRRRPHQHPLSRPRSTATGSTTSRSCRRRCSS